MTPILSVCIPTMHSRRKSFNIVLGEALRQSGPYADKVEIVSNSHGGELSYDANLITILRKAKGEWCWIVCDDDQVEAEAVGRILNLCEEYSGHIMHLNHRFPNGKEVCEIISDKFIIPDKIQGLNLSFAPSICIKREDALKHILKWDGEFLRDFLHVYLFLTTFKEYGEYLYYPLSCIRIKASEEKTTWGRRIYLAKLYKRLWNDAKNYGYDPNEITFMSYFYRILMAIL